MACIYFLWKAIVLIPLVGLWLKKKKGTSKYSFLPVCLCVNWLSTCLRNISSDGGGRGCVFSIFNRCTCSQSFYFAIVILRLWRQTCPQGTNEQFGVDRTAKVMTVPLAHSSSFIQIFSSSLENCWWINQEVSFPFWMLDYLSSASDAGSFSGGCADYLAS